MGQQQLLLVILVTIIVGIATVVAINVFGTSAASANEDAVRQDILTIASAAQGWYIKPDMMGGGGNSFQDITFNDFNFSAAYVDPTSGTIASNMNGTYVITSADAESMVVTAHPASDEDYTGTAESPAQDASQQLKAEIFKGDISWLSN